MSQFYPIYAVRRFGWRDGLRRAFRHSVMPILRFDWLRRKIRRFVNKDRRQKRGGAITKWAINRDGDLYLVQCPACSSQVVHLNSLQIFECCCGVDFKVHLEDGAVKIYDHRQGDVKLPSSVAWDPASKCYRFGLNQDYPWWWESRDLGRDLWNGKDAHGHCKYELLPTKVKHEVGQGVVKE